MLLLGCAQPAPQPQPQSQPQRKAEPETIGTATMAQDGSIHMQIASRECDGSIAHGDFTVRPGEPQYAEIVRHAGGLAPGQSKPVPAWPEPPCG